MSGATPIKFKGTHKKAQSTRFNDRDGDSFELYLTHLRKKKRNWIKFGMTMNPVYGNGNDDNWFEVYINKEQAQAIADQLTLLIDEMQPPHVDADPHVEELDDLDDLITDIEVPVYD